MTDLTDQDRRDMLECVRPYHQNSTPMGKVARYILANVEAIALSEDLAHVTENWQEWPTEAITATLAVATDLAKQMEHDLAEARAEVERLTDVNETLRRTDNYKEFKEQFLTVQKGAESNAESLDPADVKPGEAWIVDVDGERRTAVTDADDNYPWNTVTGGGWMSPVSNKEVTLITRLVPAPRVITDPEGLDMLAEGTIIRSREGDACRKSDGGDWSVDGLDWAVGYGPRQVLPATVLWEDQE